MRIAVAALGLTFVLPASAMAQDAPVALPHWPATLERVSQGFQGAVYIDPSSIKRNGDLAEARSVAIPPKLSSATAYMWSVERISCSERTIQKLIFVNYDEDGKAMHTTSDAAPDKIPPGVQAQARIDRVCGGPPDPARTETFASMYDLLKVALPLIEDENAKAAAAEAAKTQP